MRPPRTRRSRQPFGPPACGTKAGSRAERCAGSRSCRNGPDEAPAGVDMESAFPRLFALPPPAPGAFGFAGAERARARLAANREKAFGVKLVDRNIELGA